MTPAAAQGASEAQEWPQSEAITGIGDDVTHKIHTIARALPVETRLLRHRMHMT